MRALWKSAVLASVAFQSRVVLGLPQHGATTEEVQGKEPVCQAQISPFDYSAKIRSAEGEPGLCFLEEDPVSNLLMGRQSMEDDDYSTDTTAGACCSKATGYCNYGPKACGTNGISPNEVCWSNCNAHAECGRYAETPGQKCPLNVCCSQYGFCGTEKDFCKVTDDEETSCQSNCKQPTSGSSGGNVLKRVIGYYEGWAHDRECQNMNFKDIPVGALTHAYFSFAYITPGNFLIAPMDDLKANLFDDFTAIKSGNPGLKTIVAVGGWTFNDPGATQTVFSDMVSTAANRKAFIGNLMGFMRKYGFDGVDFDWEYPGAPDRSGKKDDGKNFVTFLKELDEVNKQQPEKYVVSFTVPTSYWYLRWFDLKAIDHVDFVNVMSYDLHGIWDSTNPIGSQVLAHTNLTEIKLALDLFWRNDVKPEKLNLGMGFYGRSFQLSDPTCHKPGCQFKGGASPGPCSKNSGTLTYREIMDVIKNNKLKPYYDKENAVKYITWNQDQWVSYDDHETFKQKIDFANKQGLGGTLIWAIDQDTDDLQALRGIVGDNNLKLYSKQAQKKDDWEGVSVPDCYVTDCGGHCNPGWLKIETQPCGGAKPVTRHSKEKDSELCCPLEGAPNRKNCRWRGGDPWCNGHCQAGEVTLELNRWGNGKYCEDGNKVYCCDTALDNNCYWANVEKDCNGDDEVLNLEGLSGNALVKALKDEGVYSWKYYCCPKKEINNWENCAWYGSPYSCFDNHCPTGHSVQLATDGDGGGAGCNYFRARSFCCDPAGGQNPFLPVSLDKLFKDPPTGDDVDSDYDLETDDTWGTGKAKSKDDEPSDSAFQFVVLASPEELQVSLDKRDGSHWLLNCENTTDGQEAQTVKMICTDVSEDSNCYKIGLGHGVPGTILQMPPNCGPGKYAVAVDMTLSKDQILPRSLRRSLSHIPNVYDLTFDYDFTRVPRDNGDTQVRIDFSNEVGYWDEVVSAAASKRKGKAKRSLDEFQGNHVRWLEEEYRDDAHMGLVPRDELHARWFGSDVLDWLREMLSPKISREYRHVLDKTYLLKIVDETWKCPLHDGRLLAQAETDVRVESSFGFTLICKLPGPGQSFDLSQSYLTFTNKGDITAIFRLEAYLDLHYDSGEKSMLRVPFPGATFDIPGIATIGPAVNLKARVEAGLVVSAVMETRVDVASWEFEQTLPPNDEYKPNEKDKADYGQSGDFNGVQQPEFYAGIAADGRAKLHAIAAVEFGIKIADRWNVKGDALASVVADGWIEAKAHSSATTTGSCPFNWGIDIGVDLYAKATAPDVFMWNLPKFNLPGSGMKPIIPMNKCPDSTAGLPEKRDTVRLHTALVDAGDVAANASNPFDLAPNRRSLDKRERITVEPVIKIGAQDLLCPDKGQGSDKNGTACSKIRGWEPDQYSAALRRRSLIDDGNSSDTEMLHQWFARATDYSRTVKACAKTTKAGLQLQVPAYEGSSSLNQKVSNPSVYGYKEPDKCNNFDFDGDRPWPSGGFDTDWATEHILELQLVAQFIDQVNADVGRTLPDYSTKPGSSLQTFCQALNTLWVGASDSSRFALDGNEFVLLDSGVNTAKERMFNKDPTIQNDDTMKQYEGDGDRAVKNLKDVMTAMKYLQDGTIDTRLRAQKVRIANRLRELEQIMPTWVRKDTKGQSFGQWQPMGLEGRWNTFIRDKCATARTKAVSHINDHMVNLRNGYVNDYQKDQAKKQSANGDDTLKDLIEKVEKIDAEWTRYRPLSWTNPF
ncbi:carbohydrate-binding module family 18 [Astrocystis sublimbata]|nr:carbohydrate-binding module family 18 [Astrocystis sublimbata]